MTKKVGLVALPEVNVADLKGIVSMLEVEGRSKLTKKLDLVNCLLDNRVIGLDAFEDVDGQVKYLPRFSATRAERRRKARENNRSFVEAKRTRVKTTVEAYTLLQSLSMAKGVTNALVPVMQKGISLGELVENPEIEGVGLEYVPAIRKFDELYDARRVMAPKRGQFATLAFDIKDAVVKEVNGKKILVSKGSIQMQSQSHLADTLSKGYMSVRRNEKGEYLPCSPDEAGAKRVSDLTNVLYANLKMDVEEGQKELTFEQKQKQFLVLNEGIYIEFEGKTYFFEFFFQTPSQARLVQGTFLAEMDVIEAFELLGHDFRSYAKKLPNGNYKIDMMKAPKRFGLSGTSTIASKLVNIGNEIVELDNGDYMLTGGTHELRVTSDTYSYVKEGKYRVYDESTGKMKTLDAKDEPVKLAAGDGMMFCDETVYHALVAEFGIDTSAWQIRMTPFGKGLLVFVPFLKDMYGADIVAFNSAVKGDFRHLFEAQETYNVELRIALFNKPAQKAKKYTNIPYQFINTLPITHKELIESADKHIDKAFELYHDPSKIAEYVGVHALSEYEGVSMEELDEDQKAHVENTLVSSFTNFLYAGEFTAKDPYMKKRVKDIVFDLIKDWTYGSVPVEGHYRFMTTDFYAILQAKIEFDKLEAQGVETHEYKDADGDVIVPSHLGLQAGTVFMVDDNDEYMMDGKEVVFSRNPKISDYETTIARTAVTELYAKAHEKFPMSFTNIVVFSCHDFNTFKQGGADNDGDTTFAIMEQSIIEAVKKHQKPSLLDITIMKDGRPVEGCPYQPKVIAEAIDPNGVTFRKDVSVPVVKQSEYSVEFSADQYTPELARELHELSKVFIYKTLEPNEIGLITDYATKILDAVRKLMICTREEIDLDGNAMTKEMKLFYQKEVVRYMEMVDILRLVQGWEIDKAKHGGAYKEKMDLSFIDSDSPIEALPQFAVHYNEKSGKYYFITPDWLAARKGKQGVDTGSVISRVRNHVMKRFNDEIKDDFMSLNPMEDKNNIASELTQSVQLPTDKFTLGVIIDSVRRIKKNYNVAIGKAFADQELKLSQVKGMKFTNEDAKTSYIESLETEKLAQMDVAIDIAQSELASLPFDKASIGVIAYTETYQGKVGRNAKPGQDPTYGLAFPWVAAREQLLEAVLRASGKVSVPTTFKPIEASDVEIAFEGLQLPANQIVDMVQERINNNPNAAHIAIWVKPHHQTGNVLHHVYVGNKYVGHLFIEKTYYFTGTDKFVIKAKSVKASKGGTSVRFVMAGSTHYNK